MKQEILKILKDKDDWKHTVEIKENAKGEPQITVKSRSDVSAEDAGSVALAEYKRIREAIIAEINKTVKEN